ncbi:Pleiotropic drug resistance protein 2 [Camellia lanceoleosa]|uniref:Pleiotropic drug resistance protein 2 n=1 Tax=Camellia lanceoleosa TaxID=1840588 RepID=A0ACC0F4N5_9ERIC|nr:Pleiotropic drug resistance protein 2 [Camellia lanceoleosa]
MVVSVGVWVLFRKLSLTGGVTDAGFLLQRVLFLSSSVRLTGVGFYPGVYCFFAPVLVFIGDKHFQVHVVGWLYVLGDVAGYGGCVVGGMTLLLGPPGSGKTTLLKALIGKSDDNLKISGKVTYCGREFKEFVPQRTSAYISQHDLHYGEMTVRETLDFSGCCLGVGTSCGWPRN